MTIYLRPVGARARLLLSAALLLPWLPLSAQAQDRTALEPIIVESETEAGATTTLNGASVSALDGSTMVEQYGNDIGTAVRATAGAFTRSPADSPTVAVNIRGLQGFGRVNTMIDGIPQTFRNISGHGGSYDDQVFLDPGLIASTDIAKGAVAGADGLGALAGAANFRTIGIDDLIEEGETTGGMARLSFGTNGSDVAATFAGAMQSKDGRFGGMAAVSGYNHGPFEDGAGTESSEYYKDEPRTILAKMRYRPTEDLEFNLTAQDYQNTFYPTDSSGYIWDVERQSVVADMHYNPGDPLIDMTAKVYWQDLSFDFPTGEGKTSGSYLGRNGTDETLGANLSNRSLFALGIGDLLLDYGVAYTQNDFDTEESTSGANAAGKLAKAGVFMNSAYTLGNWDFGGGLRYDYYELDSTIDGEDVTRDDGKLNGSLVARYHFDEEWSAYGSFAETMRAPTVTEMFYSGGSHATASSAIYTNPDLEAETAETFELGVNFAREGLWAGATVFKSDIENYINYEQDSDGTVRFINTDGTVTMTGLELSGGFDTDRFFGSLSVTIADTDQPISNEAGFGKDSYGELPDDYVTLDLGVKLMNGDARIGGRVRYVGESSVATYTSFVDMSGTTVDLDSYTLFDLYGSWQVSDGLELYASVENLTDKFYREAGTGLATSGEGMFTDGIGGRGRTIEVGMTYRF
ncbi:TonB-dependent receptor domain-containing protein [Celeribacter sp. ULVN23_4]